MADMLLTDPPYNVAYEGKSAARLKIQNDSMEGSAFRAFLNAAFSSGLAALRAGSAMYVWHADTEGFNFRGACADAGLQVRQCLIWVKSSMVMGRQDYQWRHEPCLYGWKEGASHRWYGGRKLTTVLEFDRPSRSEEHPTMKPVALFEHLVQNSTQPDQVVLDSFGGSGTTIIACERLGRAGRAMELEPGYVDVIVKRWQDFTGEAATLEGTGHRFAEVAQERGA